MDIGENVYFLFNSKIYKGVIVEDLGWDLDPDHLFQFFRVKSCNGSLVLTDYELYTTVDKLVESIMHESCWN